MILILFFLMSNVFLITNVKSDDNNNNTHRQNSVNCLDNSFCVPILIIIFGSVLLVMLTFLINTCIITNKKRKIKRNEAKAIEYNIYSEI
jgi:hypothetical protein